jgi:hypothetical protein
MSCIWMRGKNSMSGKKRITVDEGAWNDAMRKASQLRQVQRDLPGMLAKVQQAQQEQAARDRAELQARQDELTGKLAALSAQARQIEESTSRRIAAATASIMNETRRANEDLRAETRHLIERQEQRFTAALGAERAERHRDVQGLRDEIAKDRAVRADLLAAARSVVADARVLHDAIDVTLPHERYAPGQLRDLGRRLEIAEANVAAGIAETALGQGQDLFLELGDLRAEVELRDAEWRATHLAAVIVVTALIEQISASERIDVVDDESGLSAELDVDFWSDGELSKIKAKADKLSQRLADESDPPSLEELKEMSERTVASLDASMTEAITLGQVRQWASQVRVNLAEQVVHVLEHTTGYDLDGEPVFAGDDMRSAFYSKMTNGEDELVVEVAPDETGKSCVIRVMSYETGTPNEYLRAQRVHTIAAALGRNGLPGTPAAEPGEPDPEMRDLARIRQRPPASAVPGRA